MKVAIYARVSTDDKEQDPERQFMKCRGYAELHDHEIVGEFQDYHTGDSAPSDRPGFSQLMNHRVEGILVYSIDRLSRQHPSKIMNLFGYYKDQGIKIVSITEPVFNMESEFSEPMMYFITWWNNYFLKKLKRDIKSGMDRAVAQGKIIGRPAAKFNERRAYQLLFVEHKPVRAVCQELGVSIGTLSRSKKVWSKNPPSFINEVVVPQTGGLGTEIVK